MNQRNFYSTIKTQKTTIVNRNPSSLNKTRTPDISTYTGSLSVSKNNLDNTVPGLLRFLPPHARSFQRA